MDPTFWHKTITDPIGLFTLVLAIFTVVLAGTSFWQGRVTQRSLKLATDEFRATHRPRVTVRSFETLEEPGTDASIAFAFVNVGDLPATVIEIRHYVGVGNVDLADPAFKTDKLRVTLDSEESKCMG